MNLVLHQTRISKPQVVLISSDASFELHSLITLLLMTQSRPSNIPLFLLFQFQFRMLHSLDLKPIEITITTTLFQYGSFFVCGGSNVISSIDLSNAYNGIYGYNTGAVSLLTFIGNWAGPIWWSSASSLLLLSVHRSQRHNIMSQHLSLLTLLTSCNLFFVMLACTALRTHLFIWTVFSPKYLYSIAWSVGQHLCINVCFSGLLFRLGSR